MDGGELRKDRVTFAYFCKSHEGIRPSFDPCKFFLSAITNAGTWQEWLTPETGVGLILLIRGPILLIRGTGYR